MYFAIGLILIQLISNFNVCYNMPRRNIVYNHISKNLSEDEVTKLKQWYLYYYKLYTCYKWKYMKLMRTKLSLNMVSLGLTVSGTIAGGITLNPIILGCISGPGILIQGYLSKSNINTKADMCRFAYTSFQQPYRCLKGRRLFARTMV